jgi:hypothetical protein
VARGNRAYFEQVGGQQGVGARPTLAATTLAGRIVPFRRVMNKKPIRRAKQMIIRGERFFFSMFVILLWG